jgi:hypothetical protein
MSGNLGILSHRQPLDCAAAKPERAVALSLQEWSSAGALILSRENARLVRHEHTLGAGELDARDIFAHPCVPNVKGSVSGCRSLKRSAGAVSPSRAARISSAMASSLSPAAAMLCSFDANSSVRARTYLTRSSASVKRRGAVLLPFQYQ